MELDPRLQNLSAADLQDFTVPHYPNFDQGYQSALYDGSLNDDHNAPAHAHAHAHAQAYAQFVTDSNDPTHFENLAASPARRRLNDGGLNRSRNVNTQNLNTAAVNPRQTRHIVQHVTPTPQFNAGQFSSPTNVVANGSQLRTPITPLVQRQSTRPQIQTLPLAPPQPLSQHQQQQPPAQPRRQSHAQQPPQPQLQTQPQQQPASSSDQALPDPSQFSHPSTFPLIPNPPDLSTWRSKFFNITEPLLLTSEEYHTYFPHVDNIYSHRSTQKYKKKPFVSHYWDCRLKGRPTGTPLSKLRRRKEGLEDEDDVPGVIGPDGKEVKKRKRKTRERDLCDVKIKVTEFFGRDELEALGKMGGLEGEDGEGTGSGGGQLTFVLEDGTSASTVPAGHTARASTSQADDAMSFGILEPLKKLPEGHPGANGQRWYMVQRVNGTSKEDDDASLDHKHTLEESDRIKKNSVQRWMLAQEKERKKLNRNKNVADGEGLASSRSAASTSSSNPSFHASGRAQQTAKSHASPASTQITLYANSYCPFAQRVWIALELKGIPYQYVEVTPAQMKDGKCTVPNVLEVCPEGIIPLLRHGTWGIWESDVILEYLEDLSIGHSLLPLGDPRLRAHSRLWKDHINRKVIPYFYAILLLPRPEDEPANDQQLKPSFAERQSLLMTTLQNHITELVNSSHATGPFFLGSEMSFIDVTFAPWIIRLSRVLEYYREFPKPEVGTRWKAWVDAVEENDAVRRTVSDEKSYHSVYGGTGPNALITTAKTSSSAKRMAEIQYAQYLVRREGFGLGGDVWGTLLDAENPVGARR